MEEISIANQGKCTIINLKSAIPLADAKAYIIMNNRRIPEHIASIYSKIYMLIASDLTPNCPSSIVDWTIAYKMLDNKKNIKMHNVSDILISPDCNLINLSKSLTLEHVNKERIIRILGFLHKLNNDMNIFDLLPDEILKNIFLKLNYKSMLSICISLSNFRKLDKVNEIMYLKLEELKMKGYPRLGGYCFSHDVSKFYTDNITEEMYIDKFTGQIYRLCRREFNHPLLLNYLYKINTDLIRGDLILIADYKHRTYIFDGYKILKLDFTIDDNGALPQNFTVINNAVPIKYWKRQYDSNKNNWDGICDNEIVWFNHLSVRDQCIINIAHNEDLIFTTFIYDKTIYKIIYYHVNVEDDIIIFTKILSDNKLLLLKHLNENDNNYNIRIFEKIFSDDKILDNFIFSNHILEIPIYNNYYSKKLWINI